MSDFPAHFVRSATSAGMTFTITDLEMATSLMQRALIATDSEFAFRTYNHAVRTLSEANELLTRYSPTADERARLTKVIAVLEARLAAFRARRL